MIHEAIDDTAAAPAATEFEIERGALHPAVAQLARVIERRNTIPILSYILVEPSAAGGLSLTGTDLDMWLTVELNCRWEAPGRFCVPAATLLDVLKKAERGAHLGFKVDDGKVTVIHGRSRHRLAFLPADDFPMLQAKDSEFRYTFALPAAQFTGDMAALAWAQGNEETRYYLKGIAMEERDGSLFMVATDGGNLAWTVRNAPAGAAEMPPVIIPRKAVDIAQRNLKGLEGEASIVATESRVTIQAGGFRLASQTVDGTFPQWREVSDRALGSELQSLALPEAEPRLPALAVAAFAKAIGETPAVELGAEAVRLTVPNRPELTVIAMLLRDGAGLPKGYAYETPAHAKAVEYLVGLATSAGLPQFSHEIEFTEYPEEDEYHRRWGRRGSRPAERKGGVKRTETVADVRLHISDGMVTGATFGQQTSFAGTREFWEEVVDYETFTTRQEKRVIQIEDEWQEGSYSIAMPRERAGMAALVTIGTPGVDERALPTKDGKLLLDAAAIARMCGDMSDVERVEMPRLVFHHGRIIARDGFATDGSGRRFVRMGRPVITEVKGRPRGLRTVDRVMTDRQQLDWYNRDRARFMEMLQPEFAPPHDVPAEPADATETEMEADMSTEPEAHAVETAVPTAEAPKRRRGTAGRAKRALAMLCGYQRGLGTRRYDDCFENFDGDAVLADMLAAIEADDDTLRAHKIAYGWVRHPEAGEVAASHYAPCAVLAACYDKLGAATPSYFSEEQRAKIDSFRRPPEAEAAPPVETTAPPPAETDLPADPEADLTPAEALIDAPAAGAEPPKPLEALSEALAEPGGPLEMAGDVIGGMFKAIMGRLDRLEAAANGSGTQPTAETDVAPAVEIADAEIRQPDIQRLRRESPARRVAVMRYLALRRQRAQLQGMLNEVCERAQAERLRLTALESEVLQLGEAKAQAGRRAEEAEWRAADLEARTEKAEKRAEEAEGLLKTADERWQLKLDAKQARIVALENEKIEKLSAGRIRMGTSYAVHARPVPSLMEMGELVRHVQ